MSDPSREETATVDQEEANTEAQGDSPKETQEGSTEQQTLTESQADVPQTFQERILSLYNSTKLRHVAVGFWLKIFAEIAIISVPMFLFVVAPGWILVWLGYIPVSYGEVFAAWIGVSGTILSFSWCMTESTEIGDADEESTED